MSSIFHLDSVRRAAAAIAAIGALRHKALKPEIAGRLWSQPYPGSRSVFSAVRQGLRNGGTIVDAPQVAIMQANFI
jgi:hypothetical protein